MNDCYISPIYTQKNSHITFLQSTDELQFRYKSYLYVNIQNRKFYFFTASLSLEKS